MLNSLHFLRFGAVQRIGLLLIYLIGSQPGNVERPRKRGVRSGRTEFWRSLCMPGLEVDSFVHEVRTFDRHLPAFGKVDHSEAIFICTLMQAVLVYRWLIINFTS
jgi:hypothetical protein